MSRKATAKKGEEAVREFAEHIERLATNVLTGDAPVHLQRAGSEMLAAVNKSIEDMTLPEETKKHLLAAEKEMLLAMKGFIDAAVKEIDRIEKKPKKKDELKKIKIE
ncbi:MAG: hypothetical protein QXE18_06100 [Thermoplasmata archaeon]